MLPNPVGEIFENEEDHLRVHVYTYIYYLDIHKKAFIAKLAGKYGQICVDPADVYRVYENKWGKERWETAIEVKNGNNKSTI